MPNSPTTPVIDPLRSNSTTVLVAAVVLLFAFVASTPEAAAQRADRASGPLVEAAPASVGMSADRLGRVDGMLRDAVENGDVPGVAALIARNGKIVYWKAYGSADVERNRAMKRDDIFRIASQSKAITATAVMMLWEEGLFRLDDPIERYIPEFAAPVVLDRFRYADTTFTGTPAARSITIRHLLTHTSGIGYGVIDGDERFRMMYEKAGITDLFTAEDISIEESVKKLAALPLHHQPGEKFTYSEGLDVLGYFIEVVSGMPFDEFLRQRLFDPLGMDDTWFYLPDDRASRMVAVQSRTDDGDWSRYPVTFYDPDYPIKGARRFFSGGAGLSSSAKDYATFLQMYLNGGQFNGTRILSRTTVATIMANQAGELFGGATGDRHMGLAFGVNNERAVANGGRGSVGTFDWGGYFNTQYFADPEEQVVGILMKQTRGPTSDNTAWKFRQLVFQAIDD